MYREVKAPSSEYTQGGKDWVSDSVYDRVCSVRHVPRHTAGITSTGQFGNFGTNINTGSGHFGKLSTTSTPVPDTSVSSGRHIYRYQTLRLVRDDINTGTGHFGKFGTTSIPVPDTSLSSVRYGHRYREYRYRTEHTLGVLPWQLSHYTPPKGTRAHVKLEWIVHGTLSDGERNTIKHQSSACTTRVSFWKYTARKKPTQQM